MMEEDNLSEKMSEEDAKNAKRAKFYINIVSKVIKIPLGRDVLLNQLEKRLYNCEGAYIKIERSAFPGTLFKFGERHFIVKEEIIGPKTVRLIEHEIKVL